MPRRPRGRPPHPDVLTPAEWRTAHAVRHGLNNRQIAEGRGISLAAVKFHVRNVTQKLGLVNRTALRRWSGVPLDSSLARKTAMNDQIDAASTLGSIGQISRHVSDVSRAEAWFRDVLGLRHLFTFPSSAGPLAFFDCDGTRLMLAAEGEQAPTAQSVLYFRVADIRAAHASLAVRGVTFVAAPHLIVTHADGTEEWMAFFSDCDGQTLALMSRVAPVAAQG